MKRLILQCVHTAFSEIRAMAHMQVPPLKAMLDNEGLNQWCSVCFLFIFTLYYGALF